MGWGLVRPTALALSAFRDNLVFFLAPSDLATKAPAPGRSFRLGGLVEQGSVRETTDDGHPAARFRVTDGKASVEVTLRRASCRTCSARGRASWRSAR